MKQYTNYGRGQCSPNSANLWKNIYAEIFCMRTEMTQILDAVCHLVKKPKPVLRDNLYVQERVGVSDRTIRRCIDKGELRVHETIKKFNYYLDEDVEAFYKLYHRIQ